MSPTTNMYFILPEDSYATSPLCLTCSDWLSNEAAKPGKLLRHSDTKHSALKDHKDLEYLERLSVKIERLLPCSDDAANKVANKYTVDFLCWTLKILF